MPYFSLPGKIRFLLIDLIRGTTIIKTFKELYRHQFLPAGELEKMQLQRLQRLFQLAQESTSYYAAFKNYEDIPVLTKDKATANFNGLISNHFRKKLIRKTTGGSTAAPFAYYITQQSQSYLWAGILLSWYTAGYRPGDKVTFFAGTSLIKSGFKYKVFYKLLNADVLPASPLNNEILIQYIRRINAGRSAIIYGYANAIAVMAEYLNSVERVEFPYLKAVVSTAELLTPAMRAAIEKAFGVKVYNQYGCNEGGVFGYECGDGQMHIVNTRAFYETAEDGSLISTDLSNEGFLMLRYNTSDIVQFSGDGCSCQRNFPVIKSIIGRQTDVVIDKNNNVLHASFFGIVFSKDTLVKRYQLVYDQDTLELNIHADESVDPLYFDKYLALVRKHSSFANYRLKVNEPFVRAGNGKHKELVDNRRQVAAGYTV